MRTEGKALLVQTLGVCVPLEEFWLFTSAVSQVSVKLLISYRFGTSLSYLCVWNSFSTEIIILKKKMHLIYKSKAHLV